MVFEERVYNTLIVSSSEKFNEFINPILKTAHCEPIIYAESITAAKRLTFEKQFDFIIINSPLPDDNGTKLAIDISSGKSTICLLFARADVFSDIRSGVAIHGVFVLSKPLSVQSVTRSLDFLSSARERLRKLEKKTLSIEEKMEEIRLVNRAKWLLIENLQMAEPDAHRYIEKQAMDRCITRRDVAAEIIKTYS